MTPTVTRRLMAVVYNPTKVEISAVRTVVETEERRNGWAPTQWFETSADDPGQGQARQALEAGATVVLAAGGDGTVRAVAEVLRGTTSTLALLPSGTGNLLARNLHLTLNDLDHAVETAFTGETRHIDMGVITIHRDDKSTDEHAYLVMAGLGLDAKMLAKTDSDLKKRIGWLAYVRALTNALRDKNQLRLRYQLDRGQTRRINAHTIIVGNCGALPANILLIPDAAIDDGQFDILLLRPEGFVGWLQIIAKVFWENGVLRRVRGGTLLTTRDIAALRYVRAERLAVVLERPEEIELDGDSFETAVGFETWIDPGALNVRVPKS